MFFLIKYEEIYIMSAKTNYTDFQKQIIHILLTSYKSVYQTNKIVFLIYITSKFTYFIVQFVLVNNIVSANYIATCKKANYTICFFVYINVLF